MGPWYAELSIKRVLTRDGGDSTHYINNIPVRRRDIHDLFLGTGLGARAYAIIEQGMISRVIEAKPEELRVFLEEAAGVSKYKERRKETEGRLLDARENLARVEDIRIELGAQLAKLDAQAKVATEYRELEARLKASQHMMWFAKQQDAARLRAKHAGEIAELGLGFDALQAELRAAEARLEALRADHYSAGDALHQKQGAYYAANAEVMRLEQQLQFARENEGRLAHQVEQITAQVAAFAAQLDAIALETRSAEADLEAAIVKRDASADEDRAATASLPALEQSVAEASRQMAEIQQQMSDIEQAIRASATRAAKARPGVMAAAGRRGASVSTPRRATSRNPRTIPSPSSPNSSSRRMPILPDASRCWPS